MTNQPPVLVLVNKESPPLHMLEGIPHVVGNSAESFVHAAKNAEIILHWFTPRDLLRDVFLMCPNLRWVHTRSAGIDAFLFPELAAGSVTLTNSSGVFSQSLGEFALMADPFRQRRETTSRRRPARLCSSLYVRLLRRLSEDVGAVF